MKAGFSKEPITPGYSMPMAGFDRRESPSTGEYEPLYVRVLAMEDCLHQRFLLCAFDLLGVDRALCQSLQNLLAQELSLSHQWIWMFATHTHSAPSGHFSGKASYDLNYVNTLHIACLNAARHALQGMSDAEVQWGWGTWTGIATPRSRASDGSSYPMPLLVNRLRTGEKTMDLLRISCHPTVLDEKNTLLCQDLPGQLQSGDCMVLNGCCGDLSTRFTRTRSDYRELQRLGAHLVTGISQVPTAPAASFGRQFRVCRQELTLSRGAGVCGEERSRLLEALQKKKAACTNLQLLREYDSRIAVLERPVPPAEDARTVSVCAADLGPYLLVGVPFEVDSADGEAMESTLKSQAGKPVYLVCYCGGYDGYLPSGVPLSAESSYEDFASRYLPESRELVWRCLKACVKCVIL